MYKTVCKYLIFFLMCNLAVYAQAQPQNLQKANAYKQNAKTNFTQKTNKIKSSFLSTSIRNPSRVAGLEAQANSNGYSIGLFYIKKQGIKKRTYWSLGMNEIKHPKEEKRKTSLYEIKGEGKPRPYVFGKLNDVYCLNLSYGCYLTLIPSLLSQGMDVSIRVNGGLSLACLKPYYLRVNTSTSPTQYSIEDITYQPLQNANYLNPNRIYSRSSWSEGLSDTKLIPGIHFSTALHIQLQPNQVWFKSIAIGATLQAFTAKLPLMIDTKERSIHPSVFMQVQVGKGW